MEIACPNCAATYRVPASLLASGKALRCAACEHEWVPEAPPEAAEPPAPEAGPLMVEPGLSFPEAGRTEAPAPDLPPPEPPAPLAARPPPPTSPPPLQRRNPPSARPPEARRPPARRAGAALRLAWLGSILLVALMGLGLFAFAEPIAAAWPPFERVRALFGG